MQKSVVKIESQENLGSRHDSYYTINSNEQKIATAVEQNQDGRGHIEKGNSAQYCACIWLYICTYICISAHS